MNYSFDLYGWLSEEPIIGRTTDVVPPDYGSKTAGRPYPNFTGYEWKLMPYAEQQEISAPKNSILTPLEFINRLTDQEAKTIIALSKTNPDVELWWIKYNKASYINLEDPQTILGIQALEYMTVIGQGRAREILNF